MSDLENIARHLSLFPAAKAIADKAALDIFTAQVRKADLASLRAIKDAIGLEVTSSLLRKQKGADIAKMLKGVDPHGPATVKATPSKAMDRLVALVAGEVNATPPYDLAKMDITALRDAARAMGGDFAAWVDGQRPPKLKQAAIKLDKNRPGLAKGKATDHQEAIKRLAAGGEPFSAPELGKLDVAGLRVAYRDLDSLFEPWLLSHKPAELKATLVRIDPFRPKVDKRPKEDYPLFLTEIAKGGSVYQPEGSEPGIGERSFPMGGRSGE